MHHKDNDTIRLFSDSQFKKLRSCAKVEVAVLDSQSLTSLIVSVDVKPVLNWTNVCSPEHTSDTSANYDSFLN